MTAVSREDYRTNYLNLLKETFDGPPAGQGSQYLDGGGGFFQVLASVSAETASRRPPSGAASIAAHCEHTRFYVAVLDGYMRGNQEKADWDGSWRTQTVTAPEWDRLRADLRSAYLDFVTHLEAAPAWGDEEVGVSMAILTHSAYHLGSIRQILRAL